MTLDFESAEQACRMPEPLDWTEEKQQLMVEACREFAQFHYAHCPALKAIYDRKGFDPRSIQTTEDLPRIPFVGVTAMKYYLLLSKEEKEAVLHLTSSGTSGQKTQVFFDQGSLDRVQAMMDTLWGQMGLVTDTPTNYLAFIYDPEQARDLGIAFTAKNEMRFAPVRSSYFAVRKDEGGSWEFKLQVALQRLEDFISEGAPVRLLGIPSLLFELVEDLEQQGRRLQLPPESAALIGGGWKAAEDKKVSKDEFQQRVEHQLGLPRSRMFDFYGMAEHSAPYGSCAEGRLHVPAFNRLIIRDPITLEVVADGQAGLIELITPYNAMMANLAILSTDLGRVHGDPCPCGYASPTFEVLGRAGISKHKGCAITATEVVKRQS